MNGSLINTPFCLSELRLKVIPISGSRVTDCAVSTIYEAQGLIQLPTFKMINLYDICYYDDN